MSTCHSCGAPLPIAVRFCSSCGTPVGSDDVATLASDDAPTLEFAAHASPRSPRPASSSSANVPFTADFSAWYASTSIFVLLSVVALAGWGFYTSLGGEPLRKPDV